MLPRRALLAAMALPAVPVFPAWGAARAWAASWVDGDGRHWLGRFGPRPAQLRLPGRAHGLAALPDGSLLVAARRPGDWLLRWTPGHAAAPAPVPVWLDDAWRSNGHVRLHPEHPGLSFWTETRPADDSAWLAARDRRTLALRARWRLPGHDPHDLLPLPGGRWLIAIGGVPRAGRQRVLAEPMDAQLLALDPASGAQQGWRLPDAQLSPRHLARRGDAIAVALQAEHADAAERAAAPLLALFDGQGWRLLDEIRQPSGYSGDVAASAEGWALSCPRDDELLLIAADGGLRERLRRPQVCALLGGAQPAALSLQPWGLTAPSDRHWDNHAVWLRA